MIALGSLLPLRSNSLALFFSIFLAFTTSSLNLVRANHIRMSRQPKLRPKTHIPGLSENWYDLATIAKLKELEYGQGTAEDRREQRVFRVKRKHVLKACDRCRVKKTKVSGLLEGGF